MTAIRVGEEEEEEEEVAMIEDFLGCEDRTEWLF